MANNPFEDQKQFMSAAEQTVGPDYNPEQAALYFELIDEEGQEVYRATTLSEILKELGDLMVVTIGAIYSLGADPQQVWDEVHRSNMSKLTGGKLLKREDGKVLKPDTYVPADLSALVARIGNTDVLPSDLVK